jgi:hypothetical protein
MKESLAPAATRITMAAGAAAAELLRTPEDEF